MALDRKPKGPDPLLSLGAVALRDRETILALPGTGFVTLSVIDAEGRSARASVRVW